MTIQIDRGGTGVTLATVNAAIASALSSYYTAAQTNTAISSATSGFVSYSSASTDAHVAMYDGTSGKVIHDSSYSVADIIAAASGGGSKITPLYDHYANAGNSSTSMTDVVTDSITANSLNNNGDKVVAEFAGTMQVASGTHERWYVKFAGNTIYDSANTIATSNNSAGAWRINVTIMRPAAGKGRAIVTMEGTKGSGFYPDTQMPVFEFMTDWTTSNDLVLTLECDNGSTDDIVMVLGHVAFIAAA